jgi:hypothetical protein
MPKCTYNEFEIDNGTYFGPSRIIRNEEIDNYTKNRLSLGLIYGIAYLDLAPQENISLVAKLKNLTKCPCNGMICVVNLYCYKIFDINEQKIIYEMKDNKGIIQECDKFTELFPKIQIPP